MRQNYTHNWLSQHFMRFCGRARFLQDCLWSGTFLFWWGKSLARFHWAERNINIAVARHDWPKSEYRLFRCGVSTESNIPDFQQFGWTIASLVRHYSRANITMFERYPQEFFDLLKYLLYPDNHAPHAHSAHLEDRQLKVVVTQKYR